MWVAVALGRSPGMSRLAICVDWSVLLLGRVTVMGMGSGRLLSTGAVSVTKLLLAPELLMANVVGIDWFVMLLSLVSDIGHMLHSST